jgi:hypothetical protein
MVQTKKPQKAKDLAAKEVDAKKAEKVKGGGGKPRGRPRKNPA